MSFRLRGFVNPSFGRSSFLIPFFSHELSNRAFVQSLKDDYIIARFCPYDVDRFGRGAIIDTRIQIEKTIGDAGLLAIEIHGTGLLVGDRAELRHKLSEEIHIAEPPSFLKLEIAKFLGSAQKIDDAIKGASELFSRESVRKGWESSERNAFARLANEIKTSAAENEVPLDQLEPLSVTAENVNKVDLSTLLEWTLRSDPFDRVWPSAWLRLVREGQLTDKLIELGVEWLITHSPLFGRHADPRVWEKAWRVLIRIRPNHDRIVDLARSILRSKDLSPWPWALAWLYLLNGDSISDLTELAKARIQSWELNPKVPRRSKRAWTWVFKSILRRSEEQSIFEAGIRALPMLRDYPRVWFEVWLALCYESPHDIRLREEAGSWLLSADSRQKTWAKVWFHLYRYHAARDPSFAHMLFSLGNDWVHQIRLDSNGWVNVWLALREFAPEDGTLVQLGIMWLDASSMRTSGWIRVWSSLISSVPNNALLLEKGQLWLEKNTNRPRAQREEVLSIMKSSLRT